MSTAVAADTAATPATTAAGPATADLSAVAAAAEQAVRAGTERLERLLGDPDDPGNPLGFRAVLAAEERSELVPEAELLLAGEGMGAQFVPAALGGRLERADVLARVVRPVFRRDMGLGMGFGITSLFAATPVWADGTQQQRERLAEVLCRGGHAAIVHREMAHANTVLRGELSALQTSRGFRLGGRKDVVINAARAQALVVYARTDPAPGSRSHSVLLLDPSELPPGKLRVLARQETTGLRGCSFAGLEFANCPAARESLVGEAGDGIRLALRTFQLHRSLSAAAVVAAVGTVFRGAVRASLQDPAAARRRRHRTLLAGIFADLLACDSLTTAVLRALHLAPGNAHLPAAEVKYLVPELLREALEELATVIGGAGSGPADTDPVRRQDQDMLTKLLRDLPAAGLGHAATAACQSVVIPQLPLLARRSWFVAQEPSALLFRPEEPLARLDMGALTVAGGDDLLAAVLLGCAERLPADGAGSGDLTVLRAQVEALRAELVALRDRCVGIGRADLTALSSPGMCALADRHALLSAAASALGVWEQHRGGDSFLGDPAWLVLALHRLGQRLSLPGLPALPADCVDRVLAEAERRFADGRSFDLYDEQLAWGGR